MEPATVPVGSWNRFLTHNLVIAPSLVAAKHEFEYGGKTICVALPNDKNVPTEPNTGERLWYNGWRETNGKKIPQHFWVGSVEVTVNGTDKVSVPPEVLELPPCQYKLFSEDQQERLKNLVTALGDVAERAFDFWLRALRWRCRNSSIGRPIIKGHASGWSTYLTAQPGEKRIWIEGPTFEMPSSKMVTPEMWDATADDLKAQRHTSISIDLVMDAYEHIKTGDLPRAVLETAMSCEAFLRSLLADNLPSTVQPSISQYIDDANVRKILGKFIDDILTEQEMKLVNKVRGRLHQLFDARNTIVHKGTGTELTESSCNKWIEAVVCLLELQE